MYILWPYILARGWPGTSWTVFWLFLLGVFLYVMFPVIYQDAFYPRHLPGAIINAAPADTLDRLMNDIESQGYTVNKTINLKTDPEMRNQVLISYDVISADGSDVFTYTWAWKAPYEAMLRPEVREINGLIHQCELIPKTDEAVALNETLNAYLNEDGLYGLPTPYRRGFR